MLCELHLSHYMVFPLKEKGLSSVSVGFDRRCINEEVIMISVQEGYSADYKGINGGFKIIEVDVVSIEDYINAIIEGKDLQIENAIEYINKCIIGY